MYPNFLRRKIEAFLLVSVFVCVYSENLSAVTGVQQDRYFGAE